MGRKKSTLEVIPSAKRLIRSLRDVGYDFRHSVADLVDNSIAAGASNVAIEMRFNGRESWLRVSDNGSGMSGTSITEAMRFGTERDYDPDELGKFGLGLKTASLSQCSRLTVASRTDPAVKRIEVRQWDLAHIDSTNRWEIIDIPADERSEILVDPLQDGHGTVVLWEVLDRVLGYKIPWGDRARVGFLQLTEDLDLHMGMVFHRFISGEARRRKKLKITINGNIVEPWDPFARDEKATIKYPQREFEIQGDHGAGIVAYSPYILPAQEKFSSRKSFDRHAGPGKWNYQQGFYIYRADRMIQSGGWSRMRTSDEHTKLARIALDFRPDLDSAFDLNVAKAKVNLPADLRQQLQPHIEQFIKQAKKVYSGSNDAGSRDRQGSRNSSASSPASDSNQWPDENKAGLGKGSRNQPRESLAVSLEMAAKKAGEKQALVKIRRVLKSDNPAAAAEIGW